MILIKWLRMNNLENLIEEIASDPERLAKFNERVEAIVTPKILLPTYFFNTIRKLDRKNDFIKEVRPIMYGIGILAEASLLAYYSFLGYIFYQHFTD